MVFDLDALPTAEPDELLASTIVPRLTGATKDRLANIHATGEFTFCRVDQAKLAALPRTATDLPPAAHA
jgi:hypothetical protein